jgi:glycosyltransferase involved in cell wall biosynthesis
MNIVVPYQEQLPLRRAHDVYVVRTAHALAGAGHTVHLLVGRGSLPLPQLLVYYGLPPIEGLRLHRLPLIRSVRVSWSVPFHAAVRWTVKRLAGAARADLVFASTLKLARALAPGLRGSGLVYDLHELSALPGVGAPSRLMRLEAQVLARVQGVVTTSEALREHIARAYPEAGPVGVVPLATYRPTAAEPPPYPDPPPEVPEAFYVGQLHALQGLPMLLEALTRCQRPSLHVVGGGHEGDLHALGRRLGLAERLQLAGFQAPGELPRLMARAHWFLMPSLARGRMPYVSHMKCYDYLAYRRPILASALPSVQELLTDGETALLPRPGDAASWADAMERLAKDPVLARRLGDGAYALGLRHSPERRGLELSAFFERVLRAGRAA